MPVPEISQLLDLEMAVLVGCLLSAKPHPSHSAIPASIATTRCPGGWQEVLDFNLVVFSPYRDLSTLLKDAQAPGLAECAWWASARP